MGRAKSFQLFLLSSLLFIIIGCSVWPLQAQEDDPLFQIRLEDLGRALFFDVNLSRNRTQSCATCHDPAEAFTDWRDNGVAEMASLGDDGVSLGDRHAPTASYAALSPPFQLNDDGDYVGGQFWDGRESDLEGQAGGPPLNPVEMNMPDKSAVVERLQENPLYDHEFKHLFGEDIFMDVERTYTEMTRSIAAFERTDFFSPFDSKYDRYLRGEEELTTEEELGMTLFFSNQFSNCNQCHQLNSLPESEHEAFTSFQYRNIGTPVNTILRELNGKPAGFIDHGLLENPEVSDPAQDGRFKTPTLRNVALSGPYMHNGVFADLRTVVLFYNKYNSRSSSSQINPETGERWAEPEVDVNLALEELESGSPLDERGVDAILAFLGILTDKRYEHLLSRGY